MLQEYGERAMAAVAEGRAPAEIRCKHLQEGTIEAHPETADLWVTTNVVVLDLAGEWRFGGRVEVLIGEPRH